jgi:ABC-2 type transport system ATP-binding protein
VIELIDVTKKYGSHCAVDAISLSVAPGELFAFLGPNGAGKTTTIKLIAGLLRPTAGEVRVCGRTIGLDGVAARARIAYVPDSPFLYEKLTGREFLRFVGEMYDVPPDAFKQRFGVLTDRLGVEPFLDRMIETYSHGMKQRVVLTSALIHDPQVLLIDEPMVGLDPKTVRSVKDLMREMTDAGRTVFMSTHTLEVAEAVADRIGIIHRGILVTVGTLAELRERASQQTSLEDIFLGLTADAHDDQSETIPE